MTIEEFRDALLRVVDEQERLVTENLALRAVLRSAVPRPGEPPLEKQVEDLIRDTQDGPVHRQYADLRQQIQRAAEDRQLLELLRQSPPRGGLN